MSEFSRTVSPGLGSDLSWPALMRKLERMDPGYKN